MASLIDTFYQWIGKTVTYDQAMFPILAASSLYQYGSETANTNLLENGKLDTNS